MAVHVCPWWIGYLLACPLRRYSQDPEKILGPYVREGMTVLEPGPGMGFFTLEAARRVGGSGRVIAVEIQPKMLHRLKRRAEKAGLRERLDARLAMPESMNLTGLDGQVDFAFAFAVVHEMPGTDSFFLQTARCLKPDGSLLLAEPRGHVKAEGFEKELAAAARAGFSLVERPVIPRSHAALLKKG
ncbi:MAG TPA: methyltransferase domain-containing protein [Bryobacteraceae bacterium]|nr:methyltransferase domain-containing protein [Bryobacteraceae bacterium]